jgi:hypothetical protein
MARERIPIELSADLGGRSLEVIDRDVDTPLKTWFGAIENVEVSRSQSSDHANF